MRSNKEREVNVEKQITRAEMTPEQRKHRRRELRRQTGIHNLKRRWKCCKAPVTITPAGKKVGFHKPGCPGSKPGTVYGDVMQ